jgi:hypothetical protein
MAEIVKQVKSDPQLMDVATNELEEIIEGIKWIETCFGKAQEIVENGKRIPVAYVKSYGSDDTEYFRLFPDERANCFAFLWFPGSEDIVFNARQIREINADFELVISFNYEKIYGSSWHEKTIENVKYDFFEYMEGQKTTKSRIEWEETWEHADDVFSGWDYQDIENKFMMRPYGVLKIGGRMKYLHNRC